MGKYFPSPPPTLCGVVLTRGGFSHSNTCHFTGIAARKDHIACGSEDNRVVVYNNMITSPILSNSFETGVKEQDAGRYGSAVCWNKHANIMLSGNSAGILKILRLS